MDTIDFPASALARHLAVLRYNATLKRVESDWSEQRDGDGGLTFPAHAPRRLREVLASMREQAQK